MKHAPGKAFLLAVSALAYSEVAVAKDFNLDREHVPDQLVVRFATTASAAARTTSLKALGAKVLFTFKSGAQQLQLPTKGDDRRLLVLAKALAATKSVLSVEANTILHADATIPNDPDFPKLYGLHNDGSTGGVSGASIHAAEAWDVTTGSKNVVVGVIDTGVDYTHPDLKDNMWTNPGETGLDAAGHDKATNGIDDDGNGYIDDWHGWDFANNDNDPMDDNNHGSHVSGTIGGHGNDGVGIVGVNWNVSIVGIKFLTGAGSGSLVDAVKAIEYATALGVTLTSNSWGGGGYSDTMEAAIQAANAKGILFVAAAGNDGLNNDVEPHYPSSYPEDNIIAVAATDNKDAMADFSCFGKKTVDVAAPGVGIWSSIPGGKYDTISGTSMAAPHVSGLAALIKARYPAASAAQIKARILNTADPVLAMAGKSVTGGRVNAFNALEDDTVAPNAVSGLAAVGATTTTVDLVWDAAGDDGAQGRAKRYELRVASVPIVTDADWSAAAVATVDVRDSGTGPVSATVTGLAFNSSGYLSLRAVDNVGNAGPRAPSIAYEVQRIKKIAENGADTMDGVTAESTWGLEQDAVKGSVFSDSPAGDYADSTNASLTLAPVAVTSTDLTLMLSTSYDLENNYDFGFIEVTSDAGLTWKTVDKITGTSPGWVQKSYSLAPFIGKAAATVQLRLRLTSDYSIDKSGWKVDDVTLYGAAK